MIAAAATWKRKPTSKRRSATNIHSSAQKSRQRNSQEKLDAVWKHRAHFLTPGVARTHRRSRAQTRMAFTRATGGASPVDLRRPKSPQNRLHKSKSRVAVPPQIIKGGLSPPSKGKREWLPKQSLARRLKVSNPLIETSPKANTFVEARATAT